jgi:hypothetical protein
LESRPTSVELLDRFRKLKKNAEAHIASRNRSTVARKPISTFRRPVGSANICGVFKKNGGRREERRTGPVS